MILFCVPLKVSLGSIAVIFATPVVDLSKRELLVS